MRKIIFLLVCALIFQLFSCASIERIFKERISVDDALNKKQIIDNSENPAYSFLVKSDLAKKVVLMNSVTVRDVVVSNNIDYDFCVIISQESSKGIIDCYVYSKDVETVSKINKGSTKVNVEGDFGRFFSLPDNAYTKIEILNADIKIIE